MQHWSKKSSASSTLSLLHRVAISWMDGCMTWFDACGRHCIRHLLIYCLILLTFPEYLNSHYTRRQPQLQASQTQHLIHSHLTNFATTYRHKSFHTSKIQTYRNKLHRINRPDLKLYEVTNANSHSLAVEDGPF